MKRALLLSFIAIGCTRIDAEKGARYFCSQDAGTSGECPGGWKCGFEGFCIDPLKPAAYRCEDSQRDCAAGWHCGRAGVCYDRATATDVECRVDVPEDCAPDYRCGLSGTCHRIDAGFSYDCEDDSHCEANWRCGPDQRCVDSTQDALRLNAALAAPLSTLIHPTLPMSQPDRVEAARANGAIVSCNYTGTEVLSTAMARGDQLLVWLQYQSFRNGLPVDCPDGGPDSSARSVTAETLQTQFPAGPPTVMLNTGLEVYSGASDGSLWVTQVNRPSTLTHNAVPLPAPLTGVAGLKPIARGGILVHDGLHVGRFFQPDQWSVSPPVPQTFDGGTVIQDVELVQLGSYPSILVATNHAIYGMNAGSDLSTGSWSLLWAPCKFETPYTRLQNVLYNEFSNTAYVGIQASQPSTSSSTYTLFGPGPNIWQPGCPTFDPLPFSADYLVPLTSECSCQGPMTNAFAAISQDAGLTLFHQCQPVGDNTKHSGLCQLCPNSLGGNCNRLSVDLFADAGVTGPQVTFSQSSSMVMVAADEMGAVWSLGLGQGIHFEPKTLTQVPNVVVGPISKPFTFSMASIPESDKGGDHPLTEPFVDAASTELGSSGEGFVASSSTFPFLAVTGRPTWTLAFGNIGGGLTMGGVDTRGFGAPTETRFAQMGFLVSSTDTFQEPRRAAAGPTGDGGVGLVISGGDTLWAADLSSVPDGGKTLNQIQDLQMLPRPRFALSPLPRAEITALQMVNPDPSPSSGARFMQGYLIASGRIFRFRADNTVVWRADEVQVEPSEAVALWADGNRVRVGFRDGSVFALPSRVRLAPPLPAGQAMDLTDVCGHTFALTTVGLAQLVAQAGQPLGAWRRVPYQSADAGVGVVAKLHSDGQGLLVFRDRGLVERIDVGCIP